MSALASVAPHSWWVKTPIMGLQYGPTALLCIDPAKTTVEAILLSTWGRDLEVRPPGEHRGFIDP